MGCGGHRKLRTAEAPKRCGAQRTERTRVWCRVDRARKEGPAWVSTERTGHGRREAAVQYLILKEVKVNSGMVQVGKCRQRKQNMQSMEVCRSMEHSWTYQWFILLEHTECGSEGGKNGKSRQVVRNR